MELEDWLREDMKRFIKEREPDDLEGGTVRHEDMGLIMNRDYEREINHALTAQRFRYATQLFNELRERFLEIPVDHQEERKQYYRILQRTYKSIYDYVADRHKTHRIISQLSTRADPFDENVKPVDMNRLRPGGQQMMPTVEEAMVRSEQLPAMPEFDGQGMEAPPGEADNGGDTYIINMPEAPQQAQQPAERERPKNPPPPPPAPDDVRSDHPVNLKETLGQMRSLSGLPENPAETLADPERAGPGKEDHPPWAPPEEKDLGGSKAEPSPAQDPAQLSEPEPQPPAPQPPLQDASGSMNRPQAAEPVQPPQQAPAPRPAPPQPSAEDIGNLPKRFIPRPSVPEPAPEPAEPEPPVERLDDPGVRRRTAEALLTQARALLADGDDLQTAQRKLIEARFELSRMGGDAALTEQLSALEDALANRLRPQKPTPEDHEVFSSSYLRGIQAMAAGDYGRARDFFLQRVQQAPRDRAARIRLQECMEVLSGQSA